MGVHGLWRLLESTGKPINPETLEGKILAVDISIWLNQAVKGVRDREGNSVQNAHLLTLFHRICKLLFFRIKPVFVFDGEAPLLKKQTLTLRRQRKEELGRESKQTNEKLLKTFLKRQALKAALGDKSKDPILSLSTVRRDEVDDIYVLPALPAADELDKNSSEEEEKESDEIVDSSHIYQAELYDDPNSMDINSEEFASLPPEMKHEILKDMKEVSKKRRTMYHKPPEHSGDFSQYQLAGLLQRNQLNQRLLTVEKEMSQRSAGAASQFYEQDGEQQSYNVESNRLVSEDHSHYILIKGARKSETATESQTAAAPWSGSFLSVSERRPAGRPEPLWRPVGEENSTMSGPSSEDSKLSQEESSPPSPRTLSAIQAAMDDSSDEEVDQIKNRGSVSPCTMLAIQQALVEQEEGPVKKKTLTSRSSASQVAFSSSEEEPEPNITLPHDDLDSKRNATGPSICVKDGLLASSSENEMEEMIGQRNKDLQLALLKPPHETKMKSNEETKKQSMEDIKRGRNGWTEKQEELEKRVPHSPRVSGQPFDVKAVMFEPGTNRSTEVLETVNVNSEASEESESEESLIEVSEDEFKQEDEADQLLMIKEKWSDDNTRENGAKKEVKGESEESLTEASSCLDKKEDDRKRQTAEEELKELTEKGPSSTPATSEWEKIDVDELEALETSLQAEQSSLTELKQQQERMANTVTGQMYLESQELLRLFGVPFLVAPMEAEAQCAALDRAEHTHGTITDDSDVWLFGGRHVFKNFFSQNKYVAYYQYSDLHNQLGLDRNKLINLAYLLGSDYTEGVAGVGYVTGMEILNEFPGPGLEPLILFSKWWSEVQDKKRLVADPRDTKVKKKLRDLKLHPGFPNPAVAQAYLQPCVDQSDSTFSWGRPQVDMIKEFCLNRFGWSSRRTEETLQPVMKQLNNQQTQLRIDSFFRMEQQEKNAIRSQRLRRAVTCIKRKEREDGDGVEEGSEEEALSPSSSKKHKAASHTSKCQEVRQGERTVTGGGFLGSEVIAEPLKNVCSTVQVSQSVTVAHSVTTLPQGVGKSSSSSGEDSEGGDEVAMVTARSVFEGNRRGCRAKNTRGRGSVRGKGRGKKR